MIKSTCYTTQVCRGHLADDHERILLFFSSSKSNKNIEGVDNEMNFKREIRELSVIGLIELSKNV